jgi:DNA-binding NarL/FixJ family response regulator
MFDQKVIILEEHPIYTVGLKYTINHEKGLTVVDCCHNPSELLLSLRVMSADIVIIDCSGDYTALELEKLFSRIYARYPHTAIVMLGENPQHQHLFSEMKDKIKAYLCKSFTPEDILEALKRVKQSLLRERNRRSALNSGRRTPEQSELRWLTRKEKMVIEYLQSGFSVSQTAQRFNRSIKTISTQKRSAMRKLGITSERELFQLNINMI